MTARSQVHYDELHWSQPWLYVRAEQSPDQPALEFGDMRLSYAELAARVRIVVASLEEKGVNRGDVVAVSLPNGLPIIELIHASFAAGFVLLLINRRLTATEVGVQLRDSGARFFVHPLGDSASEQVEVEAGTARFTLVPRGDVFEFASAAKSDPRDDRALSLAQEFDLSQPRFILYTSGTSGKPKGVILSGANLLSSARGSAGLLGADASDRWLLCMPIFHVGGLSILLRSTLAGSQVIVHEGFTPELVSHDLDAKSITGVSLVANMLKRILDLRSNASPPSALTCVLVGGGPVPAPLVEAARTMGFPIAPTYGLTEAASQVATRRPEDPPTAGLSALAGTELKIIDDTGASLPADRPGQICVRSGSVMTGYLNRPEATRETLQDGWLRTGDVGSLDGDGRLFVHDRRSDLIVSGGENIYPAEVESALLEHPAVAEAGVAGVADEAYGARPVAWLVAGLSGEATSEVLHEHCRARLAHYKCPVKFVWRSELPRTANGKLIRRKLGGRSDEAAE